MFSQSSWLATQEDLAKAKHLGASPAGLVVSTLAFDNPETKKLIAWSSITGQVSRYVNLPKHSAGDEEGVSSKCRSYHLTSIHAHVRLNQIAEDLFPIFKDFLGDCEAARQVFNAKVGFASSGSGERLYYSMDYSGMKKESKRLHKEGYSYVAKFDIKNFFPSLTASFFDNHLGNLPQLVPLSLRLDLDLTLRGIRKGLPINCVGSQLLARIALIPLDLALRARGYKFIRYQDDLWVHCRSDEEMLQASMVVRQVLHGLGLKCTDYKTELLQPRRSEFLQYGLMPNGIPLENYFTLYEEDEPEIPIIGGVDKADRDKGYQESGSDIIKTRSISILDPNLYRDFIAPGMSNPSQSVERFVFENHAIFDVPASGASLDEAGDILSLRHADFAPIVEHFPESSSLREFHQPVMDKYHPAKEGFLIDYVGVLDISAKQRSWKNVENRVAEDRSLAPLVLFRAQAGVFRIDRAKFCSSSSSSFHHVASDVLYLMRSDDKQGLNLRRIKDQHEIGGLIVEAIEMAA